MAHDVIRPDVSLVTSGHDVADARLHRLCAAFVAAGLSVELIGLGSAADAPVGLGRVLTHGRAGMVRRAADAVRLPWTARGRVLFLVDPDTVPSAWLRRVVRRTPLVVDVHEDYAALLRDRAWAQGPLRRAATGVVRLATALARRADLTVVADEHVPPTTARRRRVVRNLPSGGYLPGPSERERLPRALHVGDLRRSRGLFAMLEAVEQAPDWTLDLVGPVAAADAGDVERWRANSPAAARVRFHGRLAPHQAWALAAGAWAGLAMLEDTPAFRDAVPTKVYEYLGCGLAVICTPLPRTAALVEASKAGVVVAGAVEAGAALQRWSDDRDLHAEAADNARSWAGEHLLGESPYDLLAGDILALVGTVRGERRGG